MKTAKYRIKIVTYANGRKDYTPQLKGFIIWWWGIDICGKKSEFYNSFHSREDALFCIDKHYEGNYTKQTIEFEYINKP